MSKLLLDEHPIKIDSEFAVEHGLNNAIVYEVMKKDNNFSVKHLSNNIPFLSKNTISRSVNYLKEAGIVKCFNDSASKELIKRMVVNKELARNYVCEWCNNRVVHLQEHHYPTPKEEGGVDIVNICPNCHYEFHHIEGSYHI